MDVRNPGSLTGDALHQRIVVGEIWKTAKARAPLICRRLVAVGPDGDVGGAIFQLLPAGEIHVNAGAANNESVANAPFGVCNSTPRSVSLAASTAAPSWR